MARRRQRKLLVRPSRRRVKYGSAAAEKKQDRLLTRAAQKRGRERSLADTVTDPATVSIIQVSFFLFFCLTAGGMADVRGLSYRLARLYGIQGIGVAWRKA